MRNSGITSQRMSITSVISARIRSHTQASAHTHAHTYARE